MKKTKTPAEPKLESKYEMTEMDYEFVDALTDRYNFDSIIGVGSFGVVFKAQRITNGSDVAIKMQEKYEYSEDDGRYYETKNRLIREKNTILELTKKRADPKFANRRIGIPELIEYGELDNHYYIVISLLGPSLKSVMTKMQKLSRNTVYEIGTQMLDTLELMHSCEILHRDLKPQNILIGAADNNDKRDRLFYLVDFGLAKYHADEYSDGYNIVGTTKYVSINVHDGCEYSYCDDVESLGYVLIRLLEGKLPWSLPGYSDDDIRDMKDQLNITGKLFDYMLYVEDLEFGEMPDYDVLRGFLAHDRNVKYDWE